MEVLQSGFDYSALSRFQRTPSIQPIDQPQEPIGVPEEEFRPEIPIEKQMQIKDELSQKIDAYQTSQEEQKDKARRFIAGYAGVQSIQTQFEILLEGIDSEDDVVSNDSDLIDSIQTLRDIQKQNNLVEAYATYQEWQDKRV